MVQHNRQDISISHLAPTYLCLVSGWLVEAAIFHPVATHEEEALP